MRIFHTDTNLLNEGKNDQGGDCVRNERRHDQDQGGKH